HRCRAAPAVVRTAAWFVNGDGHHDAGVRYRREAHKGAAVVCLAVFAIHNLSCRAAFARDPIPLHLSQPGTVRPCSGLENLAHLTRHLRAEDLLLVAAPSRFRSDSDTM